MSKMLVQFLVAAGEAIVLFIVAGSILLGTFRFLFSLKDGSLGISLLNGLSIVLGGIVIALPLALASVGLRSLLEITDSLKQLVQIAHGQDGQGAKTSEPSPRRSTSIPKSPPMETEPHAWQDQVVDRTKTKTPAPSEDAFDAIVDESLGKSSRPPLR